MSNVKATPETPIPPNNVQDGSDIKERIEQLCYIIQKCGNMIPYNFDGCLTLEQKFIILMQTVRDNMLNQTDLLNTWKELYDWIDNYFENLNIQDEINNKLDEIIESGQFEDILNQYFTEINQQVTDISNKVDGLEDSVNEFINKYSLDHVLIVAKTGGNFNTIHDAIESILSEVNINNQYVIFVLPGDYNEQLEYLNVHGINIIGASRDAVTLHYNGQYPGCVVHMDGDILFKNMTVRLDNDSTYAFHMDTLSSGVQGNMIIDGCRVIGGTNAFGIGTGTEYNITIKNCELSCSNSGDSVIYAHNSPNSNTPNQHLTVTNNKIIINSGQYAVKIDDAANSYGNTNSILYTVFVDNFTTEPGKSKVSFRKNTNNSGQDLTYMPKGDPNIKFDYSSKGNANIPGLNYNEGYYKISQYFVLPTNSDTSGKYMTSIPIAIDATNYKLILNDVTVPGMGSVTEEFTAEQAQLNCFNISTTNNGYTGRCMSLTVTLTCP